MATYTRPRRIKRANGKLSGKYYTRVYDGGVRTWRSTGAETITAAREQIKTWVLRDAQGERRVEGQPFSEVVTAWFESKPYPVHPASEQGPSQEVNLQEKSTMKAGASKSELSSVSSSVRKS